MPDRKLTSIVSYPERGIGGNNRYRGNCSPKLVEDLISFLSRAKYAIICAEAEQQKLLRIIAKSKATFMICTAVLTS